MTLGERTCTFSTHSSPTVPHLPATAADLCTTTLFFDRVCVFGVFGWIFQHSYLCLAVEIFKGFYRWSFSGAGGSRSASRTTFLQRGIWLNYHTAVQRFSRARILSRRGRAVRSNEFNRTRDASHVQVHSFSLTSKRLPSVPDTPSEQPLVLPGWCCYCLLRSLCRPHLVVQMLSSFLRPHAASLTSSVT